jgi:tripartite-type tricarboxylate transporter receptor subunit TctC
VPTMAETGFEPSLVVRAWFAILVILVPKRTPRAIVDRLHASIAKAITDPEVKVGIERLGNVALPPKRRKA